jgi:hypothetical protein
MKIRRSLKAIETWADLIWMTEMVEGGWWSAEAHQKQFRIFDGWGCLLINNEIFEQF